MRAAIHLGCIVHLFGLYIFSQGFFSLKKASLSGFAEQESTDAPALFDRLVFVLVDALRSDFAFGRESQMHNLHDLIATCKALPFTARASTPTVTLPRLKCLTTGAITGFLDAILNIAESDSSSTIAHEDSWIQQLKSQDRRIHMYGDDTWLRLFPDAFANFEGTSSFFVSDFTEVDNNVTRHIDTQLSSPSWDALVLHYLGLDHIGHLDGPRSVYMPEKQREMDEIVSHIYQLSSLNDAADDKSTLIMVLGDHGMTGDGNHGGASDQETHTAFAMISEKLPSTVSCTQRSTATADKDELRFYTSVLQSDIVPALSLSMGLPIPQNSLGVVPREVLELWNSTADRYLALQQNAKQLQRLIQAGNFAEVLIDTTLPCSTNRDSPSCSLQNLIFDGLSNVPEIDQIKTEEEHYKVLSIMQSTLLQASNQFKTTDMHLGLVLLVTSTLANLVLFYCKAEKRLALSILTLPILHSCTAFASSFVEEEQVFWYYMTTIALLLQTFSKSRDTISLSTSYVLPLLLFRLFRRYNQTGQKYAGASDISSIVSQIPYFNTVCIIFSFIFLATQILSLLGTNKIQRTSLLIASTCQTISKSSILQDTVLLTRLTWLTLVLSLGSTIYKPQSRTAISTIIVQIVFLLQSRTRNVPMLILSVGIDRSLRKCRNVPLTVGCYLALQQASFFALGNSNSLSGLDLSQAYNGVSAYNEYLVGILLFVSSFIGPIYWQVSLMNWLAGQSEKQNARQFAQRFMSVCSCMYATALCISCYTLRHHLFVFSVFSPKLLFAAAWTCFYFIAIPCM